MPALLVLLCIAAITVIYFQNNPLEHSRRFMLRRFVNWFPLGMTYSFMYMARYNPQCGQDRAGGRDDQ